MQDCGRKALELMVIQVKQSKKRLRKQRQWRLKHGAPRPIARLAAMLAEYGKADRSVTTCKGALNVFGDIELKRGSPVRHANVRQELPLVRSLS